MGLLDNYVPDAIAHSVSDIDLGELAERGIRGLLIDVDNTLIGHCAPEMTPERLEWAREAVERFEVCLLSNSVRGKRMRRVAELLGCPGIAAWKLDRKPLRGGFRRALGITGTSPQESAMIGDQLVTDILGGNRAGLHTIWVERILEREFVFTRHVQRRIERLIVRRLGLQTPAAEEAVKSDEA